jgi:hypothetical protein
MWQIESWRETESVCSSRSLLPLSKHEQEQEQEFLMIHL